MVLSDKQLEMCESSKWDFSDLKALFLDWHLEKVPRAITYRRAHQDLSSHHGEKRRFGRRAASG